MHVLSTFYLFSLTFLSISQTGEAYAELDVTTDEGDSETEMGECRSTISDRSEEHLQTNQ